MSKKVGGKGCASDISVRAGGVRALHAQDGQADAEYRNADEANPEAKPEYKVFHHKMRDNNATRCLTSSSSTADRG